MKRDGLRPGHAAPVAFGMAWLLIGPWPSIADDTAGAKGGIEAKVAFARL